MTALKEGTVTITATAKKNKSATATVKIKVVDPKKATKVQIVEGASGTFSLSKLKLTLANGTVVTCTSKKFPLTAKMTPSTATSALTWKSGNTKIAKVSAKGVVTVLKTGTVNITVTTATGKSATFKLKVVK